MNPAASILTRASSISGSLAPFLPGSWGRAAEIAEAVLGLGASLVEAGVDPIPHVERLRDHHDVVNAALARAEAASAAAKGRP